MDKKFILLIIVVVAGAAIAAIMLIPKKETSALERLDTYKPEAKQSGLGNVLGFVSGIWGKAGTAIGGAAKSISTSSKEKTLSAAEQQEMLRQQLG